MLQDPGKTLTWIQYCISVEKTKVLHVRRQDNVSATTSEEAGKICKYGCPHLNCGYKFYSKRGMKIHAGKCTWADEYQLEKILDCEGPPTARRYLIKWKGYSDTTWEPRGNIHPSAITEFEKINGLFDYQ